MGVGWWGVALVAAWVGCGDDGAVRSDGGSDAASGMDAATDGGRDAGAAPNAGPDAAPDAALGDGGPDGGPDAAVDAGPEGCDPGIGIECDGDWDARCSTPCDVSECCSPVGGRFECVPRADGGTCPAADLWVDTDRVSESTSVTWQEFPDGDCAIVEGCVDAPGWRRLLKFATWTPNTGTADMYLGEPSDTVPYFEYSACHMHYHFDSYARYELRAADGTVVAEGHKQAFCLLDYYQYPGTSTAGRRYTCEDQGIQAGFQDVYGEHLDCQWVDVTDVEPGDYLLRIEINYLHMLNELDYTNNVVEIPVTVPADDPVADITTACPAGTPRGADRECGFTREGVRTCTPGESVTVGCSATCGLGSCTGDPFVRICEESHNPGCEARFALAANDDSGCGSGRCGRGGDCCPQATFTCPSSGSYVVFWAPYDPEGAATCTVAVE